MKCPKCQYLTFDQADRCRNCGYEFALSVEADELDLPIKTGDEALGPLADFALGGERGGRMDTDPPLPPRAGPAPPRSTDLPLFRDRLSADDSPLVSLPAVPRPPVAVRKSTITRTAPPRPEPDEPTFDLEPAAPERGAPPVGREVPAAAQASRPVASEEPPSAAPVGARLGAAVLDLLLLGAIDVTVLYLTLRLCGLNFAEAGVLPIMPFAAYLAILNGGYMAAFTAAGGQSLGKMVTGIRVVSADEHAWTDRVPFGQAVLRSAGYLVSLLPAGLGLLPALVAADRRALHDRLAGTRVVKA